MVYNFPIMKIKICPSGAVRLLAVLAIAVASAAFDWKPKPTAKMKEDLAVYAKSVGETKFAAEVEKAPDAETWMRAAIRRGSELLKESEKADYDDKKRMAGLRIIEYPLHVDNYGTNTTLQEKHVFNKVIREYCVSARDRVFKEVAAAKVPKGSLRLWRIYNMGYIMKGPKHTVAIDITARPEFYIIDGNRYMPQTNEVVWTKSDWKRLTELADMIFVTHPHGDHYNRAGIEAFIAANKPVVVPCDLMEYVPGRRPKKGPDGKYIVERDNITKAACCVKLTTDHDQPVDVGGVKVWNFHGNQGKDTPCNVYLLDIDGVRVAHNGDNYDRVKEKKLSKCPPADVIIASTWNNIQSMVSSCMGAQGFDRKNAVLLPSHENELGHNVKQRESYWEMYVRKDRLNKKDFPWPRIHPLSYGENITVAPPRLR